MKLCQIRTQWLTNSNKYPTLSYWNRFKFIFKVLNDFPCAIMQFINQQCRHLNWNFLRVFYCSNLSQYYICIFPIIQPITISYLYKPILHKSFFILFNVATFLLINNLPCNFIKHTASTPDVHFITVVTICKKTFRCPIPACRDIFCIWLLRMYAPTGSKISKFEKILLQ